MSHINLLRLYLPGAFLLIAIQFSHAVEIFDWKACFENTSITMRMGESREIHLKIVHLKKIGIIESNVSVRLAGSWDNVKVHPFMKLEETEYDECNLMIQCVIKEPSYIVWYGVFTVDTHFIGNVHVFAEIVRKEDGLSLIRLPQEIQITVKQRHRAGFHKALKQYMRYYLTIFDFILYVNFGLVLDLVKVKTILRNPLRTFTVYLCNFIVLPLVRSKYNIYFLILQSIKFIL